MWYWNWNLFLQNDPQKEYQYKEVIQKPIAPAYKEILEKTKSMSLKHKGYVVDVDEGCDNLSSKENWFIVYLYNNCEISFVMLM